MTPSELKYHYQQAFPDHHFFDTKTMRFFGDTMSNFSVSKVEIDGEWLWCLSRKNPTKHAKAGAFAWFDCETYQRRWPTRNKANDNE